MHLHGLFMNMKEFLLTESVAENPFVICCCCLFRVTIFLACEWDYTFHLRLRTKGISFPRKEAKLTRQCKFCLQHSFAICHLQFIQYILFVNRSPFTHSTIETIHIVFVFWWNLLP